MYYLMLTISALLFSVQFLLNNEYRKESGNTCTSALKFSLYTSVSGLAALLCINRFRMELSAFSAAVAAVYSMVNVVLAYSSIKAFLYANLSVYSVFAMIGGMLLPFGYGVMCGEALTLTKVICCILITACVIMSVREGENTKKAVKYYIAVFVLNGMVGVISKFHQMNVEQCVDSGSFMILTKIFSAGLSAALLALQGGKSYSVSPAACACAIVYSLVNSAGNLMLLIALVHLPASVQYPVVTGGTIFFSVIISAAAKEKVTKKEYIAAAVAFAATVFMAF